ncbi:sulfite exporter TauE/SafE family protein [Thermovibrio sp.]
MSVLQLFLLVVAGLFSGFVAGLFGIGGGVILVPVFWFLFSSFGVNGDLVIKLSVATSLSVIALTTLFTSASHLLRGVLGPREVLRLLFFSVPGVALGVWLAKILPAKLLKKLFGLLLVILGIRSLKGSHPKTKEGKKRGEKILYPTVFASGLFSSLFGIGGGVVINSILFNFSSLPVEKVVAVASLSSFLNAVFGTIFYMFVSAPKVLHYQVGFVYLPATLFVSIGSVVGGKLGLVLLRRLSQSHLKRAFGVLLILIGLKALL